jgi:2',3'-cyclic-nucleotide 2'-phosphodiesterase/3'-nucleotidase/5'-nucleotidase
MNDDLLTLIGNFQPTDPSVFDQSAAEIVAFNPANDSLYVVNGDTDSIDVLDLSDPTDPTPVNSFNVNLPGGSPNSLAIKDNFIAVAVANDPQTDNGVVEIFTADGTFVTSYEVGALPDMVTFSLDGSYILTANEGEPDGGIDPEGSVSIIDITNGIENGIVNTADFNAFDGMEDALRNGSVKNGVRIFPGKTVSEDVEPEYITFSADGTMAYVALQENNALAIVDIATATVTDIKPLGVIDHSLPGNGIDASDEDGVINIANYPVYGMFMPDGIATIPFDGQTFIVTANEGDDRGEDDRVGDLILDPIAFPDAATLQLDENLGRLGVSTIDGDTDLAPDGDFDELFSYGTRSFSIFDESGNLVFDSGDQFEQITAVDFPANFNASNDDNEFDNRSDNKGPEPEGVVVAKVGFSYFAFVGLERIGGVAAFDVTDPFNVEFKQYINPRDFSQDPETDFPGAGDLGPEGLTFISAEDSPNNNNLLVVANEVSGSTSIYEIALENSPGVIQSGNSLFGTNNPATGDQIFGGIANEIILGFAGDDSLSGGGGTDNMLGGFGDDLLIGGSGDDFLDGQFGNDTLDGAATTLGAGQVDRLIGGTGDDLFILGTVAGVYYQGSEDLDFAYITDFNPNDDLLQLKGEFGDYNFMPTSVNANGLNITGQGIFFQGTEGDDLVAVLQQSNAAIGDLVFV